MSEPITREDRKRWAEYVALALRAVKNPVLTFDAPDFRRVLDALDAADAVTEALELQRQLWGYALPDLDQVDNERHRVPFSEVHNPVAYINAALAAYRSLVAASPTVGSAGSAAAEGSPLGASGPAA